MTGPGPERKVSEIYIAEPTTIPPSDAIKVRHILYSPDGDPSNASQVAANDPAWARAQSLATETYAKLKTDPGLFDSIARKESDEESDLGPTGTGGKLPYFDPSMTTVDPAFLAAIQAPGLKPGDILPPVKSAFGWHVIQIMYKPTDVTTSRTSRLGRRSADFELARDNPMRRTRAAAATGLRGREPPTDAIFAVPVGKTRT